MTSRQSEWSGAPVMPRAMLFLAGAPTSQCQGQVIFPQWGGVPGWAEPLYGRHQAECPADLQPSASWKSVPPE